jgi:hypothetical protein
MDVVSVLLGLVTAFSFLQLATEMQKETANKMQRQKV